VLDQQPSSLGYALARQHHLGPEVVDTFLSGDRYCRRSASSASVTDCRSSVVSRPFEVWIHTEVDQDRFYQQHLQGEIFFPTDANLTTVMYFEMSLLALRPHSDDPHKSLPVPALGLNRFNSMFYN
jgi:hypothetical protein